MRNIIAGLFLTFALSGCALFSTDKLSAHEIAYCANSAATLQTACNDAVDALEKADILTASINTGLSDAFKAGTLTKEQTRAFRARTKQADAALDKAAEAIRAGSFTVALNQATVTKALLDALNKEIAAELAKGK